MDASVLSSQGYHHHSLGRVLGKHSTHELVERTLQTQEKKGEPLQVFPTFSTFLPWHHTVLVHSLQTGSWKLSKMQRMRLQGTDLARSCSARCGPCISQWQVIHCQQSQAQAASPELCSYPGQSPQCRGSQPFQSLSYWGKNERTK